MALKNDFRESSCASGAVERLVHKLGNHLTLPQMIGNALKQDFPACREIDVLDETLGRTIDLTRSFSDFIQTPAQTFEPLDFLEILDRIPTTRDLLLSRIFEASGQFCRPLAFCREAVADLASKAIVRHGLLQDSKM
jgi:hypothetical protein